MKYLIILLSLFPLWSSAENNCLTASQVEEQIEEYLEIAELAYEAKFKFESHLEMLNVYGIVRKDLDPIYNAEKIHQIDRLTNSTMRLVKTSLQFVEDYETDFKVKMEGILSMHYSNRRNYASVEGDEDLDLLSKEVGYNHASHGD